MMMSRKTVTQNALGAPEAAQGLAGGASEEVQNISERSS
jgi:hypothetical protein